jgi:ubiquinol-cytochrome c reductase cytochrome b subunit
MKPRQHLWASGVTLYILICAAAFFGYVLPWGQISYWAATVIFNLLSTVPLIGDQLVLWIWGGFSVDNATLNRIFSLHYLIPFLIAGLVVVHLALLHKDGNGNPLGIDARTDKVPFVYYAVQAKYPFPLVLLALFFSFFLFFYPNFLGHTDNYIPANPLSTPAHIVPEWYFLPFYAILRSIPSKSGGAAAFAAAIAIWYTLPFFQSSEVQRSVFRPIYRIIFWLFTSNFILLIWLGQQVAEEPFLTIGQIATLFYFSFFLVIIPGLGYIEQYLIRYSD